MPASGTRTLDLVIIDDDPQMVRLLERLVKREMGDAVVMHTFVDPLLAQQHIDHHCCDILVTDLQMPGVDGLQLLRFAKTRNAWTQVIFMTAHSTWDAISEALELGASDYLVKPLSPADVAEVLQQTHGRCRRWQAALGSTLAAVHGRK